MISYKNKQVDREDYLLKICSGKNVLNVGCLAADKKSLLHNKIESVALSCLGLDIFDVNIPNYIKGDAQNMSFDKQFDVVVIGEVIEHLWNIEGCLRGACKALKVGGKLVITTPNAYYPVFLKDAIRGKVVTNDPYHVLLFDITTLCNMLNNFSGNMFSGEIFFYKERTANLLAYKIQRIAEKIKIPIHAGLSQS
jgi:SAM-dependent methyltransferase